MADIISRNATPPKMQSNKKSSKKTPRRPVTPGKNRAKTGRDLWTAALKKRHLLTLSNTHRPSSPKHKTPTEYFIDTLRKTGIGISAETNKIHSLTGLKGNSVNYPYLSSSHYLRQVIGTEKFPDHLLSARINTATPAYKTQEEYYDEVLALRKQIAALTFENGTHKTKIRRLEEENVKKQKEIDSLLNPGKNVELRRAMADGQADSSALVHGLKQKVLKLEIQLRDKESAFSKLQADLKTTKVDEMRVQLETLYAELMRLQMSHDKGSDKSRAGSENTAKVKALNETVIRLSRSIEQLQTENKSLKEDLDKAMRDSHVNVDAEKEFLDMNRAELLMTITSLEKKLDQAEREAVSFYKQEKSYKQQGKMELRGSVEDRLQQLDLRETELLDEVSRLKEVIKNSREDKKKVDSTGTVPPTPRRRSSKAAEVDHGSRPASARQMPCPSSSPPQEARAEYINKFQGPTEQELNRAAAKIQRTWKSRKTDKEVNAFIQNRAAKKLQHSWLDYRKRKYDEEVDDAALTIQEALKGSHARRQRMQKWSTDDIASSSSSLTDDGVHLIQSSLRGHRAHQQQLRNWRNQNFQHDDDDASIASSGRQTSPSRRSSLRQPSPREQAVSSRKLSLGGRSSAGQRPSSGQRPSTGERPSTGQRPSSAQRSLSVTSSKRGSVTQTFKARYDVPGPSHAPGSDDDDDDIMF